jgi:type VI protein secretion system component VasK
MMKDPTDLPGIIETANYAAAQNDRWLFIALLLIFLGAIAFMTRWFMKRMDKMQDQMTAVQDKFNSFLEGKNAELATVIQRNTDALNRCQEAMQRILDLEKGR